MEIEGACLSLANNVDSTQIFDDILLQFITTTQFTPYNLARFSNDSNFPRIIQFLFVPIYRSATVQRSKNTSNQKTTPNFSKLPIRYLCFKFLLNLAVLSPNCLEIIAASFNVNEIPAIINNLFMKNSENQNFYQDEISLFIKFIAIIFSSERIQNPTSETLHAIFDFFGERLKKSNDKFSNDQKKWILAGLIGLVKNCAVASALIRTLPLFVTLRIELASFLSSLDNDEVLAAVSALVFLYPSDVSPQTAIKVAIASLGNERIPNEREDIEIYEIKEKMNQKIAQNEVNQEKIDLDQIAEQNIKCEEENGEDENGYKNVINHRIHIRKNSNKKEISKIQKNNNKTQINKNSPNSQNNQSLNKNNQSLSQKPNNNNQSTQNYPTSQNNQNENVNSDQDSNDIRKNSFWPSTWLSTWIISEFCDYYDLNEFELETVLMNSAEKGGIYAYLTYLMIIESDSLHFLARKIVLSHLFQLIDLSLNDDHGFVCVAMHHLLSTLFPFITDHDILIEKYSGNGNEVTIELFEANSEIKYPFASALKLLLTRKRREIIQPEHQEAAASLLGFLCRIRGAPSFIGLGLKRFGDQLFLDFERQIGENRSFLAVSYFLMLNSASKFMGVQWRKRLTQLAVSSQFTALLAHVVCESQNRQSLSLSLFALIELMNSTFLKEKYKAPLFDTTVNGFFVVNKNRINSRKLQTEKYVEEIQNMKVENENMKIEFESAKKLLEDEIDLLKSKLEELEEADAVSNLTITSLQSKLSRLSSINSRKTSTSNTRTNSNSNSNMNSSFSSSPCSSPGASPLNEKTRKRSSSLSINGSLSQNSKNEKNGVHNHQNSTKNFETVEIKNNYSSNLSAANANQIKNNMRLENDLKLVRLQLNKSQSENERMKKEVEKLRKLLEMTKTQADKTMKSLARGEKKNSAQRSQMARLQLENDELLEEIKKLTTSNNKLIKENQKIQEKLKDITEKENQNLSQNVNQDQKLSPNHQIRKNVHFECNAESENEFGTQSKEREKIEINNSSHTVFMNKEAIDTIQNEKKKIEKERSLLEQKVFELEAQINEYKSILRLVHKTTNKSFNIPRSVTSFLTTNFVEDNTE